MAPLPCQLFQIGTEGHEPAILGNLTACGDHGQVVRRCEFEGVVVGKVKEGQVRDMPDPPWRLRLGSEQCREQARVIVTMNPTALHHMVIPSRQSYAELHLSTEAERSR